MDLRSNRHYRELVAAEPRFARLVDLYGEVDPFRWQDSDEPDRSKFAAMAFHIVGQQISVRAAKTIFGRLAQRAGGEVTAARLAELEIVELRAAGLSGAKARYLNALAHAQVEGRIDLEHLDHLSDGEAITQLVAQPGIGVWSAQLFVLHQLHRPDILPAPDLWIRRGVQQLMELPAEPTVKETIALGLPWSPNRSYAAALLWSITKPPPQGSVR
ncbi:DNA-3-methyladenine glycosylase family protein [Cryptosporangium arvum]|uniref:DNA-3-methyladenine glycosylase II n=1 Tax=Cryptosporangium arvum DSM 44712 TaxID=927661 RepID=A0A010YQ23_9ACTN|nr:DNA-3-methyladenine glycosylase [Cryptosporangium arvum]EXG82260.1 HhH-GPD superfamily base excision DNA repair protein [Cryptosporangium arvum DSM 44712]